MAEFKFNCPQCKQHIECDIAYVGSKINCPACKQEILVPPVAPAERMVKLSTLRNISSIGLGTLLVAGIIVFLIFNLGESMQTIWAECSVSAGGEDQWSFEHGKIIGHAVNGDGILEIEKQYTNVTFSATVCTTNREASLAIRIQDAANCYIIIFAPVVTSGQTGFIRLVKRSAGSESTLAEYKSRATLSAAKQTAKIMVIAKGPDIEVRLNGTKVLHATDATFASGNIGFRIYGLGDAPCDATFSKVKFR